MNANKILGDIIRLLPHPISSMVQEIKYKRKVEKLRKEVENIEEKKIFGIGLSRTGTTSLERALKILGYNCGHFNSGSRVLNWPELFMLESSVDTPVSARFESLYYTFPDSKFIYTVRNISEWVESMKRFYGVENPSQLKNKWKEKEFWGIGQSKKTGWGLRNGVQISMIQKNLYANHDTWEKAYKKFDNRVKRFFSDKDRGTMLELNITGGEGWGQLCPFLECEIPEQPFPHVNRQGNASPWVG